MKRTSSTHPIHIAAVSPGAGYGRIGVTFCPGKIDPTSPGGAWERDLGLDLDAIRDWGACVLVTLIEAHEFELLKVPNLGREVARRHMEWLHLPILDVSTPDAAFEATWSEAGEGLRARLRCGFDIVIHCRGGLGRAGTVAAMLLAELGIPPTEAVAAVRRVRPGAVETLAQERYVLSRRPIAEHQPDTSAAAITDRAVGALLGLAVGDAVGTTLEFKRRDTYEPLTEMVGGGPFDLEAGQWTDDTAMAMALCYSLSACGGLDEADLMGRFHDWYEKGTYSCNRRCFDIGMTTERALRSWKRTGNPMAGSTSPDTAGNGSLMRLAPISIYYWNDRPALRDAAARQSRTTHGAPEAVDACVAYAEMTADAIEGAPRSVVLRARTEPYAGAIAAITQGSWRGRPRTSIRSSGYVGHSMEAALWSVGRSAKFRGAIFTAANLCDDADTTAAISGQLAAAIYGASGIEKSLLAPLFAREQLERFASRFCSRGLQ